MYSPKSPLCHRSTISISFFCIRELFKIKKLQKSVFLWSTLILSGLKLLFYFKSRWNTMKLFSKRVYDGHCLWWCFDFVQNPCTEVTNIGINIRTWFCKWTINCARHNTYLFNISCAITSSSFSYEWTTTITEAYYTSKLILLRI